MSYLLPGITKNQMVQVDKIMVEQLNIPIESMMEFAGYNLAKLSLRFIQKPSSPKFVVVIGSGNNGGGGLVAIRKLLAWGCSVEVYIPRKISSLRSIPLKQLERIQKLGGKIYESIPEVSNSDYVVIDSYIGYNYTHREDTTTERIFNYYKDVKKPIISLDVPSGLDSSTGKFYGNYSSVATLSLAFIKSGQLQNMNTSSQLFIADIGIPQLIFQNQIGLFWEDPFSINSLNTLYDAFKTYQNGPLEVKKVKKDNLLGWII